MFKQLSTAAAALSVSLFSGCAIHPVPEDVTGVTTPSIVKQIRCETRDAARAAILRYLEDLALAGNVRAQALLSQYEANREDMVNFDYKRAFPGDEYQHHREVFEVIYSAAVAYNFDLTMTEDNNLGAGANFLGPWAAKFTLGLTGDFNRTRQNERTFTITDKFSYLLVDLNYPDAHQRRYCDGRVATYPNYIYPITGNIGIWNTVYTFLQMTFFDGLAADKDKPGGSGAPAMADKLTFTTTVDLTATPKVVFSPAATGFQITDASLTPSATRKDVHQVIVGLALDTDGTAPLSSLRGFVFSSARATGISGRRAVVRRRQPQSKVLVLNRVTASTTSNAEQIAVYMIDQLKSRELQLIPPASP
jgi:hypothetical protein